nr:hypothetical protein CFP56_04950 [Quercus suber]
MFEGGFGSLSLLLHFFTLSSESKQINPPSYHLHCNTIQGRGTRENWHKISHIPDIKLDWKYVQRDGEPQFHSDSHSEMDDDQHNEFGSEISEEGDVQEINDKDDVVEVDKNHEEDGVDLTECVADEQVESLNSSGICLFLDKNL